MSSNESDIEMQTALPKKTLKKAPKSPTTDILKKQDAKKMSTKEMIHQALVDLKSRKGTSLQAIKKYIEDKYKVDVEKINYLIKKNIKQSVELGTIVQVKGVGASGSFKLGAGKDKLDKKKKIEKKTEQTKETKSKPEKPKSKLEKPKLKPVKKAESNEKNVGKKTKKVEISKSKKIEKNDSDVKKKSSSKKEKALKMKMTKGMQTPAKKRAAMMKRKSIGSIIKPPKMKPKAKA
ncbi:unnamed protein product [Euphydryas editha]|uniref:H15 domain-containing protein n=1 Tax=Euphydryas editha TaxID=104508 RepID=A0AAU9TB22_EUPED|nr:unnamed protein product [Euphydryas editha]